MQLAVPTSHRLSGVPFRPRASMSTVAVVSAALLGAGLLLPDPVAGPLIGLGLAGLLAARLSTMRRGWSPREAAAALAAAARHDTPPTSDGGIVYR